MTIRDLPLTIKKFNSALTAHCSQLTATCGRLLGALTWIGKTPCFLCYNSADIKVVREAGQGLQERSEKVWLDEDDLPPGTVWWDRIVKQLKRGNPVAVFFGPHDIGKWQAEEINVVMEESADHQFPVIPVLLPGVKLFDIPVFFRKFTCIEISEHDDWIDRLAWGVTSHRSPRPYAAWISRVGLALASCPAGQDLRRVVRLLNAAFARSPRARGFA